jgi:hypothetical protein
MWVRDAGLAGQVRVFGQPLSGINTRAGYMFQTGLDAVARCQRRRDSSFAACLTPARNPMLG